MEQNIDLGFDVFSLATTSPDGLQTIINFVRISIDGSDFKKIMAQGQVLAYENESLANKVCDWLKENCKTLDIMGSTTFPPFFFDQNICENVE